MTSESPHARRRHARRRHARRRHGGALDGGALDDDTATLSTATDSTDAATDASVTRAGHRRCHRCVGDESADESAAAVARAAAAAAEAAARVAEAVTAAHPVWMRLRRCSPIRRVRGRPKRRTMRPYRSGSSRTSRARWMLGSASTLSSPGAMACSGGIDGVGRWRQRWSSTRGGHAARPKRRAWRFASATSTRSDPARRRSNRWTRH